MPTGPKITKAKPDPKTGTVLVYNRVKVDGNGMTRAGNVIINYTEKHREGADCAPVIYPITVGLSEVPREHWDRACEEARGAGEHHVFRKFLGSKRLQALDSLDDLGSREEVEWALKHTASKSFLKKVENGVCGSKWIETVADIRKSWGSESVPKSARVVQHFASFARAG